MERIRVVSAIPSLNGGTGKDLIQKAVAMDSDGYEVTVFAFVEPGTFSGYADDAEHVDVLSPGRGTVPSAIRAGQQLIAERDPHVVHAHLFKGYLVGVGMTVGYATPLVYSVQNLEDNKSILKRTVHRTVNNRVDRLVAISSAVAEDYRQKAGVADDRISVVHNSAAFDRIVANDPVETDGPVIGTVARLTEVKRLDVLLSAVAKVQERFPDVECWLIGEDQGEEAALRQQAEDLGISDAVSFEGWVSDPYDHVAAMDAFVLPSRTEGMGMVAVEALSLGVPTITSDVGGLRDVVRDGETGWRVPVGDVDRFADRIEWCLDNPESARAMAATGSDDVRERFAATTLATEQQKVYTKVLATEER